MKLGAINEECLHMKSLLIILLEKFPILFLLYIDCFRKHIGFDLDEID